MGIPNIDLRETYPLGEPRRVVRTSPPPRPIGFWEGATLVFWTIYIGFMLSLAIVIIYLFGPLIGIAIILLFIGKLRF